MTRVPSLQTGVGWHEVVSWGAWASGRPDKFTLHTYRLDDLIRDIKQFIIPVWLCNVGFLGACLLPLLEYCFSSFAPGGPSTSHQPVTIKTVVQQLLQRRKDRSLSNCLGVINDISIPGSVVLDQAFQIPSPPWPRPGRRPRGFLPRELLPQEVPSPD